ncbi:hypothetical protein RHMOL_Rhmol10G0004300 [Rhododendron molle]|uniref:Uncharacterized protein n=1 Tax=Rhododendron molle TaxID=49168 RepID=A0ACC0LXG5_RHOML|nr:hypothetical protein RHMOL_Rhmol10G0004300 [Rhododendron molle]
MSGLLLPLHPDLQRRWICGVGELLGCLVCSLSSRFLVHFCHPTNRPRRRPRREKREEEVAKNFSGDSIADWCRSLPLLPSFYSVLVFGWLWGRQNEFSVLEDPVQKLDLQKSSSFHLLCPEI